VISLRDARPDDEAWLRRSLLAGLIEEYGHFDAEDFADEWRQRYRSPAKQIWIADVDGTPAGFLWALHLPDPSFPAGDTYIYYLAVLPAHRRQGIAAILLRHLRAAVPGAIRLLVRHDSPAKRLYARLGAHLYREEWVWPEQSLDRS
jgi:ribosomal protein S18 acetylase RimI-like enzyme